jgi:DNA-binding CsgD family transcriptional regulator
MSQRGLDRLSVREREIAFHVARELTSMEIAAELGVTEQTVKFHLTNMFRALGVRSRVGLALVAFEGAQRGERRRLEARVSELEREREAAIEELAAFRARVAAIAQIPPAQLQALAKFAARDESDDA